VLSSLASRSTQSPRPPRTTQAAATHRTRRGPPCQKSTPCPGSTGDSDSLPDGYPVPVGPTALEDGATCSRSLAEPPPPPSTRQSREEAGDRGPVRAEQAQQRRGDQRARRVPTEQNVEDQRLVEQQITSAGCHATMQAPSQKTEENP